MNIKTIQNFIYLFAFMLMVVSCGEDNDQTVEEVQLSDANAVTEAITVSGAEVVSGNPPAPSQDPEAPQLSSDDIEAPSVQGEELFIDLNLISGDAAGIYLQIPGADSYFDIPASEFAGGRILQQEEPGFSLELPDNIEPGEFCADVCVYDAEERVSNIIEVCVIVNQLGGENSDFLIGTWNITQIIDTYDGETDTVNVGELTTGEDTYELFCADGQTTDEVTVEETSITNFIRIIFAGNGALQIEESGEDNFLDFENSTCENPQLEENIYDYTLNGGWSYDGDGVRGELIMIADFIDETTGEREETVIDLTVTLADGTMVGVQDFGDGETVTVIVVKQ